MTVDFAPHAGVLKDFTPIAECSTGGFFPLILGNEDKYAGLTDEQTARVVRIVVGRIGKLGRGI